MILSSTSSPTSVSLTKIPTGCCDDGPQQPSFPLGAQLDNGNYIITKPFPGSASCSSTKGNDKSGRWRGVRTTDGAKVIVTLVLRSANCEPDVVSCNLKEKFALEIRGIAPLLYTGSLEHSEQDEPLSVYDAMVELEPDGVTLASLLPDMIPSPVMFKLKLVFDCAVRVMEAQEKSQSMGGALRPEYIYVNPKAEAAADMFRGLVPRAELFRSQCTLPATAGANDPPFGLFGDIYSPFEPCSTDERKENDAYNLISILACLLTGGPPFAGDDGLAQREAYARGELRHDYEVLDVNEGVIRLMKEGMHTMIDSSASSPPTVQDILWVLLTAMAAKPQEEPVSSTENELATKTESEVYEI